MTCVCGHSNDLHIDICGCCEGPCESCSCKEFCEDIDRDELEVE